MLALRPALSIQRAFINSYTIVLVTLLFYTRSPLIFKSFKTLSLNSWELNGLLKQSSAPKSKIFFLFPFSKYADTAKIFTSSFLCSLRIYDHTSKPSIPIIFKSNVIRSGLNAQYFTPALKPS